MNDKELLEKYLTDTDAVPSVEWVEAMRIKYPYLTAPALLLLRRGKNTISREKYDELLSFVAINSSDRKELAMQLGEDLGRFINFCPEEPVSTTPDTETTIDSFLDRYGNSSDKEIAALESAIFNPTPEYALTLEADTANLAAKSQQDSLIDSFLAKNVSLADQVQEPKPVEPETPVLPEEIPSEPQGDDTFTFSESLASVYIKQRKFAKAYDILVAVKAHSEQPSPHIDDQLRFLNKLIKMGL